jgi:carboxypeptidase C (cathepsin A)
MRKSLIYLSIIILTLCVFINSAVVVNKLDTITKSSLVYSGFMPISDSSADKLFFTFYSAKDAKADTDIPNFPLIVVVGSPGSSAQYYNLAGMGPLTLNPDMTTVPNPSSVTSFANVMFLDLLGNGFSFLANTTNFPTKSE